MALLGYVTAHGSICRFKEQSAPGMCHRAMCSCTSHLTSRTTERKTECLAQCFRLAVTNLPMDASTTASVIRLRLSLLCLRWLLLPLYMCHVDYVETILPRQCDDDNRSWYRRCNNIVSYEFIWIRRTCDYI